VPFFNYGLLPQTWEDPSVKDSKGNGGELAVRLVTLDGAATESLVFLHSTSGRHFGAETLGERLQGGETLFLPCSVGGRVELVNLDQVAYLDCPPDLPEVADLDEMAAFRAAATLELVNGERLSGDLRYRLPATGCRISDLLNVAAERFLLLTTGDRCFYVNRRAILRVRTEASSCQ
jgi:hypothetical protein